MSWKTTALESIFQNLYACLEDLNASDRALAKTMLSPNGILSGYLGTELQNIENPDCVRVAQAAMQDLLDHSRKTFTAKVREYEMLNRWLKALARHLGSDGVPELVKPLEEDPDILLLKDLHEPHTKADLADHLQVTEKTIQNKISAIEKGSGGVRLGGQLVHLHIKTTQASTQEKRLYQTVNRMHPLILQLNTAQVGSLLTALAREENYYAINRFTAACIWDQLSDYGKERIKKIFLPRDEDLKMLIQDLENPDSGQEFSKGFLKERELLESEELDLPQQLLLHMKSGHLCTVQVRQRGKDYSYPNCYIKEGPEPGFYLLVPQDGEGSSKLSQEILVAEADVTQVEEQL